MALYDRLNPEVVKRLESSMEQYPASVSKIISALKKKNFYLDLTYGELSDLALHGGQVLRSWTSGDVPDWFEGKDF